MIQVPAPRLGPVSPPESMRCHSGSKRGEKIACIRPAAWGRDIDRNPRDHVGCQHCNANASRNEPPRPAAQTRGQTFTEKPPANHDQKHAESEADGQRCHLYGFPIQQLVVEHTHVFALMICTAITLSVGFASWHLFEQSASRLKPKRGYRRATAVGALS